MLSALTHLALEVKHLDRARDRVAPVTSLVETSRAELKDSMIEAFLADRSYRESEYLETERDRAVELATEKYRTNAWNFGRDQGFEADFN